MEKFISKIAIQHNDLEPNENWKNEQWALWAKEIINNDKTNKLNQRLTAFDIATLLILGCYIGLFTLPHLYIFMSGL